MVENKKKCYLNMKDGKKDKIAEKQNEEIGIFCVIKNVLWAKTNID